MARIRTIKPEFWTSDQVSECSIPARLLFIGLWNFCDDNGIHPDQPRRIKAEVFPFDDITASQVTDLISELVSAGLIERYEVNGQCYIRVPSFKKHQRIDQATYRHPLPDGTVTERGDRRYQKDGLPPRRKPEIKAALIARDGPGCHYCGEQGARMEIDHKVPIAAGGTNDLDNLLMSCLPCNRAKGAKEYGVYLADIRRRAGGYPPDASRVSAGSTPTERKGEDRKKDNSSASVLGPEVPREAEAGPGGDSRKVREIIAALDDAIVAAFGPEQRRPWPGSQDSVIARRWLADGATVELCRDVFADQCARLAAKGKRRPDTLGAFTRDIAAAIEAQAEPAPAGRQPSDAAVAPSDPERTQWWVRLRSFREDGFWRPAWGSRPGEPGCRAPKDLLAEHLAAIGQTEPKVPAHA